MLIVRDLSEFKLWWNGTKRKLLLRYEIHWISKKRRLREFQIMLSEVNMQNVIFVIVMRTGGIGEEQINILKLTY